MPVTTPKQWEKEMSDTKWYKLVFRQVQPIHIGSGSYGVVNETRIFIPGWTMWGALTKAYGVANNWQESDWKKQDNQKLFEKISCFFPCFDSEGSRENILFPKFEEGEFCLGEYSEDKFRAKFVDTFMSTAIDSLSNTALDDSLHELNVILPAAKADFKEKAEENQLYWVGIVKIDDTNKIPREVYIGGDVKYGLGKLVLESNSEQEDVTKWLTNEDRIINYLAVRDSVLKDGKIELLVEIERSWEKSQLNVRLRQPGGFFYIPGTQVEISARSIVKGIINDQE